MKNALRLGLSLVLSVLFLWLAFRNVDLRQVLGSLKSVRVTYVLAYVVTLVVIQICRAWRWDILVRPFARLDWRAAWRISNLGNMLIMLLPLRLGELGRPYLMKKQAGARFTSTMGAVTVERVIDGLLVTLLFFATTYELGPPYEVPTALRIGAFAALGLFAGATGVIVVALLTHGFVPKWVRRITGNIAPKLTDKVIGLLDAFVTGLRSLPDVRAVVAVVFWTLAYWAANALGFYWLMLAFGWTLPMVASFIVVCVLVIGIMIPAGPGFLGTYQGAIVAGLAIFGVSKTDALAYSMVAYPINLAVVVGFGLPYLFGRAALHVGDMVRESEQPESFETESQRSTVY